MLLIGQFLAQVAEAVEQVAVDPFPRLRVGQRFLAFPPTSAAAA